MTEREAKFTLDGGERIVEGRTVNVRDKGKMLANSQRGHSIKSPIRTR